MFASLAYTDSIETIDSSENVNGIECLFLNVGHKFEYLMGLYTNIYTYDMLNAGMMDGIRWILLKTTENKPINEYYIKNKDADKYLCATSLLKQFSIFKKYQHRKLNMMYMDINSTNSFDECKWYFREIGPSNKFWQLKVHFKSYMIWNAKFDEPLFAKSKIISNDLFIRNVFLFHEQNVNLSNKDDDHFAFTYRWKPECLNQNEFTHLLD